MNMSHLHSALKCAVKLLPRLKIRDVLYCVLGGGSGLERHKLITGQRPQQQKALGRSYTSICLRHFNKHDEADKILKMIIISYSGPFLCIVSFSTDPRSTKFGRYNLTASHRRHICSCEHKESVSTIICIYVCGIISLQITYRHQTKCTFAQWPY
jgi:hypothetical protein